MSTATQGQPLVREVMDIRQAADYLGISGDTLYRYASESFMCPLSSWETGGDSARAFSMPGWTRRAESRLSDVNPVEKKPVRRAR